MRITNKSLGILSGTLFIGILVMLFILFSKDILANNKESGVHEEITIASDNNVVNPLAEDNTDFIIPNNDTATKVIQPKFIKMRKDLNTDSILGHISIGDTSINYPVVQWTDNFYYTERDIYGNKTIEGSIYLDYENRIEHDDKNTVLYGHNMNKDYMFHSLRYYYNDDFYQKNKYITFDTIYGNQTWEVFAFYKTDTNFNYIEVVFEENGFSVLLDEIKARSLIKSDLEVTPDDRILTLSTCSNQEKDTRFVVTAKLISENKYTSVEPNMFYD